MLLGISTSSASTYFGSFKQNEFRYVKSIDGHSCSHRNIKEKIVAPTGWYFEIPPDSWCRFRLTKVKSKKNRIDDLYVQLMPNDSEQIDWPVEKIKARMNELGLNVDLIEITSHGKRNSISSRSFVEIDKKGIATRRDQFKVNGFDLIILSMSANSVGKLKTSSRIYSEIVQAIIGKDN